MPQTIMSFTDENSMPALEELEDVITTIPSPATLSNRLRFEIPARKFTAVITDSVRNNEIFLFEVSETLNSRTSHSLQTQGDLDAVCSHQGLSFSPNVYSRLILK